MNKLIEITKEIAKRQFLSVLTPMFTFVFIFQTSAPCFLYATKCGDGKH
jgi:hypothetical protein